MPPSRELCLVGFALVGSVLLLLPGPGRHATRLLDPLTLGHLHGLPERALHKSIDALITVHAVRQRRRTLCLNAVRRAITDELRPHFEGSGKVALLGVPTHGNLGDNILHLAEVHLVAALGKSPAVTCPTFHKRTLPSDKCPDPATLLDTLGPNPLILFHAGGNWGDLWREGHAGRLAYLARLDQELQARNATSRVLQLPQSLFYADTMLNAHDNAVLQRLRAIDFTLYLRQRSSLAYAPQASGRLKVKLMPDIAFLLSDMDILGAAPTLDVLILLRQDHERAKSGLSTSDVTRLAGDVFNSMNTTFQVKDWVVPTSPLPGELEASSPNTFPLVRYGMAQRLIKDAKVVITDRLHVSIVALLADRHHIMIENSYGKLSGVREVALPGSDGGACGDATFRAQWARDMDAALVMARRILSAPFVIA